MFRTLASLRLAPLNVLAGKNDFLSKFAHFHQFVGFGICAGYRRLSCGSWTSCIRWACVRVGQVGDLDAYLGERYIGYFDGKYYNDDAVDDYGEQHYLSGYRGTFHSVKGAKLEFYVYAD